MAFAFHFLSHSWIFIKNNSTSCSFYLSETLLFIHKYSLRGIHLFAWHTARYTLTLQSQSIPKGRTKYIVYEAFCSLGSLFQNGG